MVISPIFPVWPLVPPWPPPSCELGVVLVVVVVPLGAVVVVVVVPLGVVVVVLVVVVSPSSYCGPPAPPRGRVARTPDNAGAVPADPFGAQPGLLVGLGLGLNPDGLKLPGRPPPTLVKTAVTGSKVPPPPRAVRTPDVGSITPPQDRCGFLSGEAGSRSPG